VNSGVSPNTTDRDITVVLSESNIDSNTAHATVHVVDATPPAKPPAPDLTDASDSGVSHTDNITNVAASTFTGTVEPGTNVRLYDSDGTTVVGTTVGNAQTGAYTVTSSALSEGTHHLTVTATDASNNTSVHSDALDVTIDTTAPVVTITTPNETTNVVDPVVAGTLDLADSPGSVQLFEGSTAVATVAVDSTGHWSTKVLLGSEGGHVFTAREVDLAGNLGTSNAITVTLDSSQNRSLFGTITHDPNSPGGEIYQLYDGLLGRAPDGLGMESWTAALQAHGTTPPPGAGLSLEQITHAFLASPEFTHDFGSYTQLSDHDFIEDLYHTALHRDAEPQGLQGWENALAQGESREDVALGIVLSPEHQQDLQGTFNAGVFVPDPTDSAVARLYYGLLDRPPDAAGLSGWENAAAQGLPLVTIAQDFINSPEYQNLHGPQTDQQFVDALYVGSLGRPADAAGEQGWDTALSQGLPRSVVALGIAESPEAQQHLAPNIEMGFKLV
jgi:hypothetical protein